MQILGERLTQAWRKVNNSILVNDDVIQKFLNEIALSLLQADVDIHLVKNLQENIRSQMLALLGSKSNMNKHKLLQQLLVKELCQFLNPEKRSLHP